MAQVKVTTSALIALGICCQCKNNFLSRDESQLFKKLSTHIPKSPTLKGVLCTLNGWVQAWGVFQGVPGACSQGMFRKHRNSQNLVCVTGIESFDFSTYLSCNYSTPVCVEQWRKLLKAVTKLQRHGPKRLLATLVAAVEGKRSPCRGCKGCSWKAESVHDLWDWHRLKKLTPTHC